VSLLILRLVSERQPIKSSFQWLDLLLLASSILTEIKSSVSKNFQGAFGATTSAATGFKFGATANMNAPQESSPVSYSDDAAYQQYLRRL